MDDTNTASIELEEHWKLGYDLAWLQAIQSTGDLVQFLAFPFPATVGGPDEPPALRRGWDAGRLDVIDAFLPDGMPIDEYETHPADQRRQISRRRFSEWADRKMDEWLKAMSLAIWDDSKP
jgi:hypothetical protein